MIGIFDSGSGGLTFLAAVKKQFPEWSYLYYADYEHCPFWDRTPEEIQSLTIAGVQKLFDAGAAIVVLACNTASAWTLRKLQTDIFPDRVILGVTIPGAEKVIELGLKEVTVFATHQTVQSRTYAERVNILDVHTRVHEIALSGDLVRSIESLLPVQRCHSVQDFETLFELYDSSGWLCDSDAWIDLANQYFYQYQIHPGIWIILGCTHYSYLRKSLQTLFPEAILIDPSEESALKLGMYLQKHSDLLNKIKKTEEIKFL
jgi:glutamate racemase